MKRRIGRKNYQIHCYDLESHNDEGSIERNKTGVWLSCLVDDESNPEDESCYLYSIDELFERLDAMSKRKRGSRAKNLIIYVWNLAHEFKFILPVLFEKGFSFKHDFDEKEDAFVFESVATKTCSSVWQLKMKFGRTHGIVVFRDLAKMFRGSLRAVAKSFGLSVQKGEIDYRLDRTAEGYVPTAEEKDYCFRDVAIMVELLKKMEGDRAFWKTLSSGSYSCAKMLETTYPRCKKPIEEYRKRFPILGDEEEAFVRKSYAGGLCYATPKHQFAEIKGLVKHIDYHQSYPTAIASVHGETFPYGKGEKGTGEPPLWMTWKKFCVHCLVSWDYPILWSNVKFIGAPFARKEEMWVWDFEIETMRKCYVNLKIEYIDYYMYSAARLPYRKFVLSNYRKRLEAIAKGDLFGKMYYKNLNNHFYGKTAERSKDTYFENFVDERGFADSIERKLDKPRHGRYSYIPVGSCITAYRRSALIEDALKLSPTGEDILYMDTDSLFYLDNERTRKNSELLSFGDGLGDFAFEGDVVESQFTAAKRYKVKEIVDGKIVSTIKAGGCTIPPEMSFEEANIVDGEFTAKTAVRAKGGALIVDKPKAMSVQEKYKDAFIANKDKIEY